MLLKFRRIVKYHLQTINSRKTDKRNDTLMQQSQHFRLHCKVEEHTVLGSRRVIIPICLSGDLIGP